METTKKEYDYGIRYYVSNIRDNLYELYPIGLIKGEISYIDSQFITDSDILPILVDKHSLTDLEIVGNVYSEDDLRKLYDYQDDDLYFLENYFYSEYKDLILIIVTENDSDYFRKSEINIAPLLSRDTVISCSLNNGEPTIALNNEALNELLNADSREELIELLKRYQKFISKFKDMQKRDGVTKVSLENGKVIKANMKNYRKEGSLKIIKKDSKTNELLEGVQFDIYLKGVDKPMFKATTDKNGEISIDNIIAGKYCIVETKSLEGYKSSDEKHCIEIDEDGEAVEVIIKNDPYTISVPKTSAFNIIGVIASIFILSGSSYFIYEKFH